ncbi:MAG TPA: amidase, partial [Pseudolabrys sp.]|nr:amidase [Pseudolabrys sp.]
SPLHFKSARELARLLRMRKLGAVELLDHCWRRYEKFNPRLNAIVVTDTERARKAAKAADKRLKKNEAREPFDGVPMTIKESFDWAGTPTTWGVPAHRRNIAATDAVAVERMEQGGAIVFGKTNVPLMLADWQTFNDIYGTTNNPWDVTRSPGGSSGGAAVALATGMSALEIGSDIGASIRNPAHYCGVYGHKPTYGIVPMRGHFLPGIVAPSDISVAGPLARSAEDLALAMAVLAAPDGPAAKAVRYRLAAPRHRNLRDFRVALLLNDSVSDVDRPVQHQLERLSDWLRPRVKRLSRTARPELSSKEIWNLYITLLRSATSRRQTDAEFKVNREKSASLSPDDDSYFAMMLRGYTLSHRDWLDFNNRRHAMMQAWTAFFADYDVLLCPAAASAAFPHDHHGERHERTIIVNGRSVPAVDQLFWAGYSGCFYLPSTVAPVGLADGKLPVGVQIIAGLHEDLTAIRFAALLEREFYAFVPPPDFP